MLADGDVAFTVAENDLSNASTGIQFEIEDTSDGFVPADVAPAQYHFYACVRANPMVDNPDTNSGNEADTSDHGLWSVTKRTFIGGQPTAPSSLSEDTTTTAGRIAFSWNQVTDQGGVTGYELQWTKDRAIADRPTTATVSDKADPTHTISGTAGTYDWRVRSYKTVSARRLNSEWSATSSLTIE